MKKKMSKERKEKFTTTVEELDVGDDLKFSDRFRLLGTLGKGAFALVVRAMDKISKEEVAVKVYFQSHFVFLGCLPGRFAVLFRS